LHKQVCSTSVVKSLTISWISVTCIWKIFEHFSKRLFSLLLFIILIFQLFEFLGHFPHEIVARLLLVLVVSLRQLIVLLNCSLRFRFLHLLS
jgi:hypothetical protein